MKENLHFKQSRLDCINNQKQKRTHKISLYWDRCVSVGVDVSIGVDVALTTDDEVYVLCIIKICSYFSFVFSVVPKKVELLKILKVV